MGTAQERNYNIGLTIANVPGRLRQWSEWSQAAREGLNFETDIPYGTEPREKLDVFVPDNPNGSVIVYWHGGFFRRVAKEDNYFVLPALLRTGAIVVMGEYGLTPTYRVSAILEQVRRAHEWIYRHIGDYGGDPGHVFGIGHSVGGLLLAEMMATDWPARQADLPSSLLVGALSLSGVFNMRPIAQTTLNADLHLTDSEAQSVSPVSKRNRSGVRLGYVYGGRETPGFKRQSRHMARQEDWQGDCQELAGEDHLSVLNQLAASESLLWQGGLGMMRAF
jgi:arylformamidase